MDDKNVQLAVLGVVAVLAIVGLVLLLTSANTANVARTGAYPIAVQGRMQQGGSPYDALAPGYAHEFNPYVQDTEALRRGRQGADIPLQRGFNVAYRSYGPALAGSMESERLIS